MIRVLLVCGVALLVYGVRWEMQLSQAHVRLRGCVADCAMGVELDAGWSGISARVLGLRKEGDTRQQGQASSVGGGQFDVIHHNHR